MIHRLIIFFLVFISTSQLTWAQTTSNVEDIKHHAPKYRQKTFSLEFLLASQQTKKIVQKTHDGSYTKFDTSFMHHLDANNEMRYFLSTRYMQTQMEDFGNEFEVFFAEFMYRRKNILTQAQHGISLNGELKALRMIDEDIIDMYGYDGSFIPQLIFKRSWGRKLTLELKVRRHFNQIINDEAFTPFAEDRLYFSATTFLSHTTMFYTQFKYRHKFRQDKGYDWRFAELIEFDYRTHRPDFSKVPIAKKEQEILTIHPAIMHFLNRKTLLEGYVETTLSDNYDQRSVEEIARDEFVVGMALYLTAF